MIPVSVMVAGKATVSERIKGRYGKGMPSKFSDVLRPVIVWNLTWKCNLRCIHCYISAGTTLEGELSYKEAVNVINQIDEVGSPLVLFSGGEPLAREDFWDIAEYASHKKFKMALSTNGTLITKEVAERLRRLGFVYVGVSIDSPIESWNDTFRGVSGAFKRALKGMMNAKEAGIEVGIRFTVTRYNVDHVPNLLDLAVKCGVRRVCFYHLVPSGRGSKILEWFLTREEHTMLLDLLIEKARELAGILEIETVTSPSDGIYIASKIARSRREFISLLELLRGQGNCGRRIVSIYPDGEVHPCQFIEEVSLGNVRETRLREILRAENEAFKPFINLAESLRGGRCGRCPFKEYCGGFRPRAYAVTGNLFGDDPACVVDPWEVAKKFGLLQTL